MLFLKEKTFFVFRGSLDNPKSIGTNNLIKEFAEIVTNPKDILKKYGMTEYNNKEENSSFICEKQDIPDKYKQIYQIVKNKPIDIDEIIRKSTFSLKEVMQKLTILELEGKIKKISGNRYIRED